jgi:hypothetical protein
MHDNAEQRAYCRKHMLPIYERWTDGNLAARRLLECESADAASHEELFRRLLDTTRELGARGNDSSVRAARSAASVCCQAYIGVPADRFAWVCERACCGTEGTGALDTRKPAYGGSTGGCDAHGPHAHIAQPRDASVVTAAVTRRP